MKRICAFIPKALCAALMIASAVSAFAIEPGDVIINEVFYAPKHGTNQDVEGVELLVVADNVNLNGLQISDRDDWNHASEDQCTIQDMGKGFLSSVRSGTLVVITRGAGTDDTDASDFVIRLFAKSSLYCNTAPTKVSFRLVDKGDNLHLLYFQKQIDFVKWAISDPNEPAPGRAGKLSWDNDMNGSVNVGLPTENNGLRFLGNKADLNDYPAAWQVYSEPIMETKTLGKPNGGPNTVWVNQLQEQSLKRNALVRATE